MEDIVAVELILENGERRYFMTWGRIQHVVDGGPLAALVLRHQDTYALGGRAVHARVCWSLQDAVDQPYFFEALLHLAQQPPPYGADYEEWLAEQAAQMEQGGELYYLGAPFPPKKIRDLRTDFWQSMNGQVSADYYRRIAQELQADGWITSLFSPGIDAQRLKAIVEVASEHPDNTDELRTYLTTLLGNDRVPIVVESIRGLQRLGATDVLRDEKWLHDHRSSRVRKAVERALNG